MQQTNTATQIGAMILHLAVLGLCDKAIHFVFAKKNIKAGDHLMRMELKEYRLATVKAAKISPRTAS